ncbi:MAG TPA: PKD domain-containing protein [Candidatus Saccharimonadales bacterium]|nr:PKD domain-containing protein [Candidatus Saccharimonadales bacterium]
MQKLLLLARTTLLLVFGVSLLHGAVALAASGTPSPGSASLGLETTIPSAAPTRAATIVTPTSGSTVSNIPVTVSGLCQSGLLVKIFVNSVFVGSTMCINGSYQLQVDLFSGRNDIVARVYDALDQAGPDSNIVTVNFNDAQFAEFGSRVSVTSDYARRGANPGDELDWPITVDGGTPPYAISVDWGDGKAADLQSSAFGGTLTLKHVYDTAGTYQVTVKVTDAKGTSAFLQLVGVANGAVQASSTANKNTATEVIQTKVIWWPALAVVPLLMVTFWLGQRHELYTLRRKLESQQ